MDEPAREYVISCYDKKLGMFGDRPESLGWTTDGQLLHYEAMLDIVEGTVPIYGPDVSGRRMGTVPGTALTGRKILDFGCGKGDFYRFLSGRNISTDYAGFDINKNMISLAREKFPRVRFEVFDIEKDELTENFDYIFLCGVFNLNVDGIDELIRFS